MNRSTRKLEWFQYCDSLGFASNSKRTMNDVYQSGEELTTFLSFEDIAFKKYLLHNEDNWTNGADALSICELLNDEEDLRVHGICSYLGLLASGKGDIEVTSRCTKHKSNVRRRRDLFSSLKRPIENSRQRGRILRRRRH